LPTTALVPKATPAGAVTVFAGAYVDGGAPLSAAAVMLHPGFDRDRVPVPGCLDTFPTTNVHDLALIKGGRVEPGRAHL